MQSFLLKAVVLAITLVLQSGGASAARMGNREVTELVKAGLPESVIVQSIDSSEPAFDTSAAALGALRKAGASEAIVTKIVLRQFGAKQSGSPGQTSANTSKATPAAAPTIDSGECPYDAAKGPYFLIQDRDNVMEVRTKTVQKSQSADMGTAFLSALTFGVVSTKASVDIYVPGQKATLRATDRRPVFKDLLFPHGNDIRKQVGLAKATVQDEKRLVNVANAEVGLLKTESKTNAREGLELQIIPTGKTCTFRGMKMLDVELKPVEPLEPGEYVLFVGKEYADFGID